MKNLILLAAILLLLLALACTNEEPLPSGFDALQRKNTGEIHVVTIEAIQSAQYRVKVNPGLTGSLLLGSHDGITSRVLLRFTNFSKVDTASVQSATLSINQSKKWGEGAGFSGTIHVVNAAWLENAVQWPDISAQYNPAESIASYEVQAADSAVVTASLPAALVNGWISGGANNGILLDFSSAAMLAQLTSVDVSTGYPTLAIAYIAKGGEADTVVIGPTEDASVFEFAQINPEKTLESETNRVWIDNSRGYRTLLRFDVSQFPKEATIHQALLTLPIDSELSATSSAGVAFRVNALTADSSWQDPAAIKVDSVYSAPNGTALSTLRAAQISATPEISYMSNIVQRWTTGIAKNYGIVVQSTGYGSDLGKVAFYNGKEGFSKPTLKITYSLPASARF